MSTLRLDHQAPQQRSFVAQVVGLAEWQGKRSVLLDRSAFYPESGGQLGDRGTLAGHPVQDVQIDEAGRVHHLLEVPLSIGAQVEGQIDWPRRRLHMALHTAQHLLSRALIEEGQAETVSARLGDRGCTVDLDCAQLEEARIARAEALVNQVIEDDLEVRAYFPTPEVLATLPLRRAPKVTQDIRVIEVPGFDVSPCGGTHVARTAEIGWLRVTGVEKDKGRVRINFDAGRRAKDGWVTEAAALSRLATRFTAGPLEVERAVERLARDLDAAKLQLRQLMPLVARAKAQELLAQPGPIVAMVEGDRELLRALAGLLTAGPNRVVVLGAPDQGNTSLLVARSEGLDFDCGAFLRALAGRVGGKGGGRPDRAEGKLETLDWIPGARALLPDP
ncbi:MAG: alanyl-tRNA editing protein [Deltaproteobacteria bacterium]|nr:alanyl-tRNA editing protein [Deltaproteobacteria bacterium]